MNEDLRRDGQAVPKASPWAYCKVTAAARYLGISPNSLRKYTDCGLVKAKRLPSGDRLYRREWLDDFVKSLEDAVIPV